MKSLRLLSFFTICSSLSDAFTPSPSAFPTPSVHRTVSRQRHVSQLNDVVQDLDVIGLVAGQENYGLAVVCVGEAIWSFVQAPSFSHAKVLIPAAVAAAVLSLVSGPMITSGDASSVGTGLFVATAVSIGLGASYVARLTAKFSPSPKEIAFLGLLIAVAGFFSFSQNLLVDGFVTLPTIDLGIDLPELPSLKLGQGDDIDTSFY